MQIELLCVVVIIVIPCRYMPHQALYMCCLYCSMITNNSWLYNCQLMYILFYIKFNPRSCK